MKEKRLIIFTHGELALELKKATILILGKSYEKFIIPVSNTDKSLKESIEFLSNEANLDKDIVIFTDFPGGSCFIASKKVEANNKNVVTISGVNLSMILSFLTKKDQLELDGLVNAIKTDGFRSII